MVLIHGLVGGSSYMVNAVARRIYGGDLGSLDRWDVCVNTLRFLD
jgi:hypothetical protein